MDTKEYIRRIMEENNAKLIQYFDSSVNHIVQNINTRITELEQAINSQQQSIGSLSNNVSQLSTDLNAQADSLRTYVNEQISQLPHIYTETEIREIVNDTLSNYDLDVNTNFLAKDNKYIYTKDGKLFVAQPLPDLCIYTKDNKYLMTKDQKIFISKQIGG